MWVRNNVSRDAFFFLFCVLRLQAQEKEDCTVNKQAFSLNSKAIQNWVYGVYERHDELLCSLEEFKSVGCGAETRVMKGHRIKLLSEYSIVTASFACNSKEWKGIGSSV
jgi:hypothetical protein